jgi:hypothetical protein
VSLTAADSKAFELEPTLVVGRYGDVELVGRHLGHPQNIVHRGPTGGVHR